MRLLLTARNSRLTPFAPEFLFHDASFHSKEYLSPADDNLVNFRTCTRFSFVPPSCSQEWRSSHDNVFSIIMPKKIMGVSTRSQGHLPALPACCLSFRYKKRKAKYKREETRGSPLFSPANMSGAGEVALSMEPIVYLSVHGAWP